MSHLDIWGKSIPDKNSQCKGPKAECAGNMLGTGWVDEVKRCGGGDGEVMRSEKPLCTLVLGLSGPGAQHNII
jgi:hypothetical protein